MLQIESLLPGDTQTFDWSNCAIDVEFLPQSTPAETLRRRSQLAGRLTVQERLEQHLINLPSLVSLFYDHRTGEAADYVAVTCSDDAIDIALYHCKAAGGNAAGNRVGDVYEVAGQIVKSVFYCDVATLLAHMEDRLQARHTLPSRFVHGDLGLTRNAIQGVKQMNLRFAIVGVQPGIRRSLVDAKMADLMAFGINYAKQGGATNAWWLISE